jgi:type VI secretion system protein ImpJ
MTQHIHWHEGLFLQPHHMQQMQHNLISQIRAERRLHFPYAYGVISSELSADALRNLLVQFKHLRVVMPSGIEVEFPASADLPPLNLQHAFDAGAEAVTVMIGVPLWDPNGANVITGDSGDSWKSRRIYKLNEIERPDENTGVHMHPMLVRRVNARLLLSNDDTSGLETLPLVRVSRSSADSGGLPTLDPYFFPPCLLLHGYAHLLAVVRDLSNQVDANRRDLVTRVSRGGTRGETVREAKFQSEHVFFLQTLNKFSARLAIHLSTPGVTPFATYMELRDLLGELATLVPGYDAMEVSAYDHDRPGVIFGELSDKIRELLQLISNQKFRRAEFREEGEIYIAELTAVQLTEASSCYLAVETEEDPRTLVKLVEAQDRFKVMAISNIHQRVRGLTLREEREVPLDLPAKPGLHYFRIDPEDNRALWRRIIVENTMAIRFTVSEQVDYKFTLYTTYSDVGEEGRR